MTSESKLLPEIEEQLQQDAAAFSALLECLPYAQSADIHWGWDDAMCQNVWTVTYEPDPHSILSPHKGSGATFAEAMKRATEDEPFE